MKKFCFQVSLLIIAMMFAAAAASVSAQVNPPAQDGRINFAFLDALAAKANDTVNLNIDERMMQISAQFLSGDDPDEQKVKELVNGLKGIYVRSLEFETENQYTLSDIEPIRAQLRSPLWTRMVGVHNKAEGGVEVYLMMNGNQVGGLTVLSVEPKEITVVNILGPIDLDKLSQLEGHLGIPQLGLDRAKQRRHDREDEQ